MGAVLTAIGLIGLIYGCSVKKHETKARTRGARLWKRLVRLISIPTLLFGLILLLSGLMA